MPGHPRASPARAPRAAARSGTALILLLAGTSCQSPGAKDCARPTHANRGYQNVAFKVEGTVRQKLFNSAYTVLAKAGGTDLDEGSRQVRHRLKTAGVDPTETALSKFGLDPRYDTTWRAATAEGALALQVSTVTRRLEATVHEAAGRLPAKDMLAWRDALGRGVRDATAEAFFADPTYHAGFRAGHVDWDGRLDTMRDDPDNQDLVNSVGGDITTAVQSVLTAACTPN